MLMQLCMVIDAINHSGVDQPEHFMEKIPYFRGQILFMPSAELALFLRS